MASKEPILIICHIFPPAFGIGGRRWAKFAKALARRGHVVHVIAAETHQNRGLSPWTADIEHPGIIVHRLPWKYPEVITRWPLQSITDKLAYRFWLKVLPLFSTGNYLDKTIFWGNQLMRTAGELITAHGIRHVVVSGAPFRLNVFGTQLKQKHGIQLTSDLRDPWTWHMEFGHSMLTVRQLQEEKDFERLVIEQSDHVITPCAHMHGHLTGYYPEHAHKILRLPHVIDPDELKVQPRREDGACTRLIYAGTLYGAAEASEYIKQLLLAFDRLRGSSPQVYERTRLDLYITGAEAMIHKATIERAGHGEHIVFHAPLPASEINERISASDAVIAFMPSYKKNFLGTKFNETFYLRRPIIHVGDPGAVSEHIQLHKLGTSIPLARLPEELPRIITGSTPLELNASYDLSDQLLDHVTDRLVKEVLQLR